MNPFLISSSTVVLPSSPCLDVSEAGNKGTGNVARLQQALDAQELYMLCPHKSFAIPPEQFSRQQRGCILLYLLINIMLSKMSIFFPDQAA